jgi:hypothetical protein
MATTSPCHEENEMKKSMAVLALVALGGFAAGCGDKAASSDAATSAKAESGKGETGKATSATSAAKSEGAASARSIHSYLPKDCDDGRVSVEIAKLLPGDFTSFGKLATSQIGADAAKADAVLKVLEDGGIKPASALRAAALCITKDPTKTVIALEVDLSKSDKPAETFAKAVETGTGKAPKLEVIEGATLLSNEGKKGTFAFIGKNTVLIAQDRALITAGLQGGGGEAAFADAKGKVVWVRTEGDKATKVDVTENGSAFDILVDAKMGAAAATKAKTDFEQSLAQLDQMAAAMPLLAPLVPVIKGAKLEPVNDNLKITASLPKGTIDEVFKKAGEMKSEDLQRMMR